MEGTKVTEYEDMVVTHVLTYGYPSDDSDRWLSWNELGITNARKVAQMTRSLQTTGTFPELSKTGGKKKGGKKR